MVETVVREMEGPRRTAEVAGAGRIVYAPGERPRRIPEQATFNGRPIDPGRLSDQGDRIDRAFGPGGRELAGPPSLPFFLLRDAEALRLRPDRVDGLPAWRVDLRLARGPDRGVAWFTRSAREPRLLRLRIEGARPPNGRIIRDLRFIRVDGLDLPLETQTELTVRQRRRLRNYVVTVTAVGRYADHRVTR